MEESLWLCKCQNNEKLICFTNHCRSSKADVVNGSVKDKMLQFIKAREIFFLS